MNSLRIIFAGTPEFGLPCLEALVQSEHQLTAIYTQPDRPAGRNRHLQPSLVKKWALKQQLPLYQPPNFKDIKEIATFAALKPDLLVVIAYGLILPKALLEIPRICCVNVHASLLPRWRGASPIQQAILHGDRETGISIMQMDTGLDTGAVFCKIECPIEAQETTRSLHDKLALMAVEPLLTTIEGLAAQKIEPTEQSNEGVTYAAKISKEDARINWQEPAFILDRKIRAFNPWPIAYAFIAEQTLRIHQAKLTEIHCRQKPGTILHIDANGLLVATVDMALLIERIQFPGGKILSLADWLNSKKTNLREGLIFQ